MVESVFNLVIYVNKEVESIIKAKSLDCSSRYLEITLVNDNGVAYDLTGHTVRFNALKEDGKHVFNNADIVDYEGGKVRVALTDQTLAIGDSELIADISIFSEDGECVLTTRTFVIEIQKTIRDDLAIESSDEYGAVLTLFQDVWDMRCYIEHKGSLLGELDDEVSEGDEQAGKTILGGINNIWNYLINQSTAGVVEVVNSMSATIGAFEGKTLFESIEDSKKESHILMMPYDNLLLKHQSGFIDYAASVAYLGERFISFYDGYMKIVITGEFTNRTNKRYMRSYVNNTAAASTGSDSNTSDSGWSGEDIYPVATTFYKSGLAAYTTMPETIGRSGKQIQKDFTQDVDEIEYIIPVKKGDMTCVYFSMCCDISNDTMTADFTIKVYGELVHETILRY